MPDTKFKLRVHFMNIFRWQWIKRPWIVVRVSSIGRQTFLFWLDRKLWSLCFLFVRPSIKTGWAHFFYTTLA